MAKVEHTSDARVLVRIGIFKHRHEVLIAVPDKMRRRRLTITNSTDDFQRLIGILREYSMPVRVGFEATGNYHRVLMYQLGVAGFDLKLVSSIALARTREAPAQPLGKERSEGCPGLLCPRQSDQEIDNLLVLVVQLGAVTIACLADLEGAAGKRNATAFPAISWR